jgi:thiol-disulfide isomerase/thioredoxin
MSVLNATDTFKEEIEKNPKTVVKYYADWCGSCKLISPKFRRLSEDERFNGVHFIEVNAEQNEEARKAAGVDNLPFFAVFKDGELVEGTATSKEDGILKLLEKLN